MASSLKQITSNDVKTVKTQLHEVIPITGSIVSGTYFHDGGTGNEKNDTVLNIKKYTHGMFQSVYDYPYLSSSANHIFDLTVGVRSDAGFYKSGSTEGHGGRIQIATASVAQATEKYNIYSQMAQILVGHDQTGAIKPFGLDGKNNTDEYVDAAVFIPFSRLLVKDEIEKGSFELKFGTSSVDYQTPFGGQTAGGVQPMPMVISDVGAATNFYNNSPAGEYGVLYSGSVATASAAVGLLYYQAGVAVINLTRSTDISTANRTSLIREWALGAAGVLSSPIRSTLFVSHSGASAFNERPAYDTYWSTTGSIRSASIDEVCDGFRHRIQSVSFRNTTELNSTIYFCRANHNEFNYSSNPTYLSASQIVVKNNDAKNPPVSYVTTVGLHSPDGVMLASAKLSEPLQKSPQTDFTIRVRLDY